MGCVAVRDGVGLLRDAVEATAAGVVVAVIGCCCFVVVVAAAGFVSGCCMFCFRSCAIFGFSGGVVAIGL